MAQVLLLRERFIDVIDEALPLLREHYNEITRYRDIPLDIDVAGYARCEELGMVRVFTVRGDDRNLIGYAAFMLLKNLHYQTSKQAHMDVLYLAPEHRGGFTAARLLRFCDAALKREGVQVVYQHVKHAHPMLGRMLEKMGYTPDETTYSKRLDMDTVALRGRPGRGEDANKARAADPSPEERINVEDEDAEHLDRQGVTA